MTMNTENTEKSTTDDIDIQRSNVTKLAFLDTAGDDDTGAVSCKATNLLLPYSKVLKLVNNRVAKYKLSCNDFSTFANQHDISWTHGKKAIANNTRDIVDDLFQLDRI